MNEADEKALRELRDQVSEEGRKTQNTEPAPWFKELLATIPKRTIDGTVIPAAPRPAEDAPAPPAPVSAPRPTWQCACSEDCHGAAWNAGDYCERCQMEGCAKPSTEKPAAPQVLGKEGERE